LQLTVEVFWTAKGKDTYLILKKFLEKPFLEANFCASKFI